MWSGPACFTLAALSLALGLGCHCARSARPPPATWAADAPESRSLGQLAFYYAALPGAGCGSPAATITPMALLVPLFGGRLVWLVKACRPWN